MENEMHSVGEYAGAFLLRNICKQKGLDASKLSKEETEALIAEWKAKVEERNAQTRADEEEERPGILDDPANLLLIPTRYANSEIRDFLDTSWLRDLREGKSGVILGGNGLGKTHMAWALAKDWMRRDRHTKVLIVNAINLLSSIKAMEGDWHSAIEDLYGEADHLVIDEIDKLYASQADQLLLFDLINHRYEWARQTIVMGNCEKEKLIEIIGQSAFSRLSGADCITRILNGEDKRRQEG